MLQDLMVINSGKQKMKPKTNNLKIWIITIAFFLVLCTSAYVFCPFSYELTIVNERNDSLVGNITIIDSNNATVFSGTRHYLDLRLPKGSYNITIDVKGYDTLSFNLTNKPGIKRNHNIKHIKTLAPRSINLSQFDFFDPTSALELNPKVRLIGANVLGDVVSEEVAHDAEIMYGVYSFHVYDEFFEKDLVLKGDDLLWENTSVTKVFLDPNEDFIRLNPDELYHIINFLGDYVDLSQRGLLDTPDRGLPKQFYLYKRDKVISLGKMIFLFCQKEAFELMDMKPEYFFLPSEKEYHFIDSVNDLTSCYGQALNGEIPKNIGPDHLQSSMYWELLVKDGALNYLVPDLNIERRGPQVSFTFDIESGRYVFKDEGNSLSPCESDEFSEGLSESELICNKPELVAWMTPLDVQENFTQYSYPHVSGLIGYRQILDYSWAYGIPTTNYFVKKDVLAYNQLEPGVIKTTQKLVDKGLIEVASHTRYHTHVGLVDQKTAKNEMKLSKEFLEEYFNTSVVGFRAPYNALAGDELSHAKLLDSAGYEYFSQFGKYNGVVPGTDIEHKQWNSDWQYLSDLKQSEVREMMYSKPYLITLDHPWNMAYTDSTLLKEKPELLDNHRANVLTIISHGGIITKAEDLDIPIE